MPRGGRGGGRGAATAGIRAVANALGIARSEVGAYTKIISEAPPLYPVGFEFLFANCNHVQFSISHMR